MKEIRFKLFSRELNKDKQIRVFLPSGYNKGKNYKVLYMHDGQNILDKAKWSSSSWEVLESFKKKNIKDIIVVGIDSENNSRTEEYVPFSFINKAEKVSLIYPKANEYASFIVNYLKPYIDYHFKTNPSYESTLMCGSSFGALITYYISSLYKGVFSKIGLFSLASFVIKDEFNKFLKENKIDVNASYFISIGDKEVDQKLINKYGDFYKETFNETVSFLKENKVKNIYYKIYKDHFHSEIYWKVQFLDFIDNLLTK